MNVISKTSLWALILGVALAAALLAVTHPHPQALQVIELEPVFITGKSEATAAAEAAQAEQRTARADTMPLRAQQ